MAAPILPSSVGPMLDDPWLQASTPLGADAARIMFPANPPPTIPSMPPPGGGGGAGPVLPEFSARPMPNVMAPHAPPAGASDAPFWKQLLGVEPGDSTSDAVLKAVLRAAPGVLLGAAAGRGGASRAGAVAGGLMSGHQMVLDERARQQAIAQRDRSLDLDEQQMQLAHADRQDRLDATQRQQAEREEERRRTQVSGILDRARDDAEEFSGNPASFAEWKEQVREQLAQFGPDAEALADSIRFPNERYLKAEAEEYAKWWATAGDAWTETYLKSDDAERERMLNGVYWSPLRQGQVSARDRFRTLGLMDQENQIRLQQKGLSGQFRQIRKRVPGGELVTDVPLEQVLGVERFEADKPPTRAPQQPNRSSDVVSRDVNGKKEWFRVYTDEQGRTREVKLPGEPRTGGSNPNDDFFRQLLGDGADPNTMSDDEFERWQQGGAP